MRRTETGAGAPLFSVRRFDTRHESHPQAVGLNHPVATLFGFRVFPHPPHPPQRGGNAEAQCWTSLVRDMRNASALVSKAILKTTEVQPPNHVLSKIRPRASSHQAPASSNERCLSEKQEAKVEINLVVQTCQGGPIKRGDMFS